MTTRKVAEILQASPASDGDGVRLMRVFGGPAPERFDPFLMMDEFGSDRPADYIGGFPSHPHRGFETITYMLEGHMERQDHLGNVGDLQSGDVQWMTAAGGIIHSEMPKQTEGLLRGFQLWLNLPAREKMQPASYRDISANEIPVYDVDGLRIKAIAGELRVGSVRIQGAVLDRSTEPVLLDVEMKAGKEPWTLNPAADHSVMLYVYEGEVTLGDEVVRVGRSQLARLEGTGALKVQVAADARVLLITGKPIGEPIVQYGPFVMNSREEINQALADYRSGRLTS